MNFSKAILVATLATLPLLSQAQTFTTYQAAKTALNQACLQKDFSEARKAYDEAVRIAGKDDWKRLEATMALLNNLTTAKDYKSVLELGLPAVQSCTDFTRAPWFIRPIFINTARAAVKEDAKDVIPKITAQLAKEPVSPQNIDCWTGVAKVLVDDALDQRKKQNGPNAQVHRVNGSTFGLWAGPLVIKGTYTIDALRLAEAETLLLKVMPQEGLTPELRLRRDEALLDGQLRAGQDEGQQTAMKRIADFVFTFQPATATDTNLMGNAVTKLFQFHEDRLEWNKGIELADRLGAKRADYFGADAPALEGRRIAYLLRANETDACWKKAALFAKRPMNAAVAEGYVIASKAIKRKPSSWNQSRSDALRLLRPAYGKRAQVDDEHRMEFLEQLFESAAILDDVPQMRTYFAEMRKIAEKRQALIDEDIRKEAEARAAKRPYTRNRPAPLPIPSPVLMRHGPMALREHYTEEAVYVYREQYKRSITWGLEYLLLAATAQIDDGQMKGAIEALTPAVTNVRYRADLRTAGKVLLARAQAKDVEDFAALVRSTCVTDNMTDDFAGFLKASDCLLKAVTRPEQIDYILALQKIVEEMKYPEVKATYTARYLPKAPRSADGALRTGFFDKLPKGEYFFPYATYSTIYRDKALKLLKSNPPPVLKPSDPAKGGQVAVAHDATGVHLYMLLKDPKAGDTLNGMNDGVNYEITVLPGGLTHYNQVFGSTRDTENKQQVEWDAPQIGRKLTRDYIFTDSTVTEDCHVFHTFVPWVMYYTRLPKNGSVWTFVICCSWAGEFRSVGGGAVHELGRGLKVTFEIPDEARDAIRKSVVKGAVGEYRRVRSIWENAEFWADPHMGDPAFFAKVVQPLLAELDEQAEIASSDKLTKAETDRLFKDYLTKWIDFRLYLDGLRADYLEKGLFQE